MKIAIQFLIWGYLRTIKTDFDGKQATEKSRLTVDFDTGAGIRGTLKASKQNCDELIKILNNFLRMRLNANVDNQFNPTKFRPL
jgi:hypothetical protein